MKTTQKKSNGSGWNTMLTAGMLVMALTFGFLIASCDTGSNGSAENPVAISYTGSGPGGGVVEIILEQSQRTVASGTYQYAITIDGVTISVGTANVTEIEIRFVSTGGQTFTATITINGLSDLTIKTDSGTNIDVKNITEETSDTNGLGESFALLPDRGFYDGEYRTTRVPVTSVTVSGPFNTAPVAAMTSDSFSVKIEKADSAKLSPMDNAATKEYLAVEFFGFSGTSKISEFGPSDAKIGRLYFYGDADGYRPELNLRKVTITATEGSEDVYYFIYVDKNVTMKGAESVAGNTPYTITVDLSLKTGWNIVRRYYDGHSVKFVMAGAIPDKNSATWQLWRD
jgi:hypothetical protein